MRRVVGDHTFEATGLKLAAMADAGGKCDWKNHIIPAKDSVLDVIRVACYVHQISEAVEMIEHCTALGYETTLNIMAISVVADADIDQALEIGAQSPAGTVVVVDSYGNLFREQIDHLVRKYTKAVEGTGKHIGMHAHNNLQLAFANTVEAIILGANRVDATMMGLGRGAGNCPMELLLGFLRNPKFKLRPVHRLHPEHDPADEAAVRLGPVHPLQHHRPDEPPPEERDGLARRPHPGRLSGILRPDDDGRVTGKEKISPSSRPLRPDSEPDG